MTARTHSAMPRARLIRFLVTFVLCVIAGFGLLKAPFSRGAVNGFTSLLVEISAGVIRVFGGHAAAQQKVLRNPTNGFGITVEDTCNASNVVILLWAAVLAFPAGWRQKAKGIAAGTLLIHAVNLVRIISLFFLGQYEASWFEFAHLYIWEGVMMLVTLVVFWIWVESSRGPSLPPKQSA